jgi:hypothetical protein
MIEINNIEHQERLKDGIETDHMQIRSLLVVRIKDFRRLVLCLAVWNRLVLLFSSVSGKDSTYENDIGLSPSLSLSLSETASTFDWNRRSIKLKKKLRTTSVNNIILYRRRQAMNNLCWFFVSICIHRISFPIDWIVFEVLKRFRHRMVALSNILMLTEQVGSIH